MIRVLALLVAAAFALSACGSSDSKSSSSSGSSSSSSSSGSGDSVTIKDFTFDPDPHTVKAGTKITFTNKDSAAHNVVFDDKSVKGIDNLNQDQSGTVTLDKAGTFGYVCSYHPGMKGTIKVQ